MFPTILRWWETVATGSFRTTYTRTHAYPHRVYVCKAMGAPRIQFSAWFVRPSLPRGTLGAYFAPQQQLSPTKQILSFRFLRLISVETREKYKERRNRTVRNKKKRQIRVDYCAIVRCRIRDCCIYHIWKFFIANCAQLTSL